MWRDFPPLFTVNLIPCRPLLGEIVNLDLNVDLQTSVSIETDAETGDSRVVVGECPNNPESISLTVLHRWGQHISAEQGIPEELGPIISALFLTLEGAEYGLKKKKRGREFRLWSQASFATHLLLLSRFSRVRLCATP